MPEWALGRLKERIKHLLCNVGFHVVRPHLPTQTDARTSASAKAAMVCTMLELQARARASDRPLPRLCDSGFRVFSQFEEDGYLVYLAAVLELEPKIF
jgi:hypothetical protein